MEELGRGPLAERRKLRHWAQPQTGVASRLLQNRLVAAAKKGDLGEECDPSSTAGMLGVLSCGPGRYCVESSRLVSGEMVEDGIPSTFTSSLGGFCVKDATTDTGINHRKLQGDYYWENATSTIGYVNYRCYNRPSENISYGVSCECTGIDVEAYTGFANCSVTESFKDGYCFPWVKTWCGDNITLCGSRWYNYNFTGPDEWAFTFCFANADPEGVSSCLTYTFSGLYWEEHPTSCLLQVDGIDCNSCFLADYDYYGIGISSEYVVYDCSNTAQASEGYSCVSAWFTFAGVDLAKEEMPCDGACMLCGERGGYITEGLSVTMSGLGEVDCWDLALFAAASTDYYN